MSAFQKTETYHFWLSVLDVYIFLKKNKNKGIQEIASVVRNK